MTTVASILPILADSGGSPALTPAVQPVPAIETPQSAPVDPQVNLRLVIEEDKASGSYVYKTVDGRTGEVVSQLPREDVLRLREAVAYKPGGVIDALS